MPPTPPTTTDLTSAELDEALRDHLAGPRRVKGDSGEVERHSLPDLIAFDRYARSRRAAARGLGIKRTRVIPPGSTSAPSA